MGLDRDAPSFRYYRNAVERHWDPGEIDLSTDRERVPEFDDDAFDRFRAALAKFGAGEQAVTEDLAPLAVVLEDPVDQVFLTTQLYEEAKHADFFDHYWREVVRHAERERGDPITDPTDDRWYVDAYDELFERTTAAMERLLDDDTPETRAQAYCHYHLTVEGILAQTGYFGLQRTFGPDESALPTLPGLVEGLGKVRSDEGRHVGFGMAKLEALVAAGIDPQLLDDTVSGLVPLVVETTTHTLPDDESGEDLPGPGATKLQRYALEKHAERMRHITDASASIPAVYSLTDVAED
jgi:ribonucleoside-diphosphate reductase beta chain